MTDSFFLGILSYPFLNPSPIESCEKQPKEGAIWGQLILLHQVEVTEFKDNGFFSDNNFQHITLLYLLWPAVYCPSIVFIVNDRMPSFSKHNYFHSLPWIRVPHASSTLSDRLGRKTGAPCGTMFTRFKNDNSPSNSKSAALPALKSLKERFSKCPVTLGFQHKNTGLFGRLTPSKDKGVENGTRKESGKR